jgi:hypothetical protein
MTPKKRFAKKKKKTTNHNREQKQCSTFLQILSYLFHWWNRFSVTGLCGELEEWCSREQTAIRDRCRQRLACTRRTTNHGRFWVFENTSDKSSWEHWIWCKTNKRDWVFYASSQ